MIISYKRTFFQNVYIGVRQVKINILLFSAFTLTFIPSICPADTPQNTSDTNALTQLQDYLQYAALNNAGLKAAFEEWKAAVEQVPQAKALPDPKLTYGRFIREMETRDTFGIAQMFPWFGKIEAGTDAASAQARAARKRYEAERLKLFREVKDVFYEYQYLAGAVKIAKDNLVLLKHLEEVSRTRYMAAAGTHPDVIRAQVELANLENTLTSLEELRKPITAKLNAVLNRQSDEMLPWPEKEKFTPLALESQKIAAILKQSNPELAAIDFEASAARNMVELAQKRFYPDVEVGVTFENASPMAEINRDPVMLMFSINLPLWRDSYQAAERQAKSIVLKTRQQRTQTENTLVAQAEQALYDFENSNRRIKLYGDVLLPQAEQLLQASETAYQAGTIDFLSLIDAQRMLLEFQLEYERAVTDNQQKLAELEMLVGAKLSPAAEEPPSE